MPIYIEPDINLIPSNEEIDLEINFAVGKYREVFLGAPSSASELATAIGKYEDFNLRVDNGSISGVAAKDLGEFKFLKVLARHLRSIPMTQIFPKCSILWFGGNHRKFVMGT